MIIAYLMATMGFAQGDVIFGTFRFVANTLENLRLVPDSPTTSMSLTQDPVDPICTLYQTSPRHQLKLGPCFDFDSDHDLNSDSYYLGDQFMFRASSGHQEGRSSNHADNDKDQTTRILRNHEELWQRGQDAHDHYPNGRFPWPTSVHYSEIEHHDGETPLGQNHPIVSIG